MAQKEGKHEALYHAAKHMAKIILTMELQRFRKSLRGKANRTC